MTVPIKAEIELVNGTIIKTTIVVDLKNRKLDLYEGKEKYKPPQRGFIPFEAVLKVDYK